MTADDSSLYGLKRQRNLNGGNAISSSTALAFTSQLSSLINTASSPHATSKTSHGRARPKKDDIFATHNRNTSKRAKRDLEPDDAGTFVQKHTTHGSALDPSDWNRSRRKMEDKARLYAAMKRGDVDDADERYAVDFDRKWAEARARASRPPSPSSSSSSSSASAGDNDRNNTRDAQREQDQVTYVDEFGRTRQGSHRDARRAAQQRDLQTSSSSGAGAAASHAQHDDRFTAHPTAPATVIYGDTIQHQAFNPDAMRQEQMAALAAKRDRSLTPPPREHFDGNREVRTKGTGFFQFSQDEEVRKAEMAGLEAERAETERVRARKEREGKMEERKRKLAERREEVLRKGAKRKAEEFLEAWGAEMAAKTTTGNEAEKSATEMTERIEAAIRREEEEDDR